ncbi:MAG: hypothetical protein P8104_04740 [Gammaproteobacteria bacterium]
MFALVLRVPIGVAEHPSDAELEALRKDAMALFMERKASEAEAAPPEQAARNEKTRQALAASWLKALGEDRKVVQQQQHFAEEDRSRLHLPPKRPMVILPVDIDIARVLITLQGNPTFAGVVVILLEMPPLRQLTELRRAYGALDIRVIEDIGLRREFSWAHLPVFVDEFGSLSTLNF